MMKVVFLFFTLLWMVSACKVSNKVNENKVNQKYDESLVEGKQDSSSESPSQGLVNPITTEAFTADPAPFIGHDGRLYVITSHDKDNAEKYNMDDYCLLSTTDPMKEWTYHGIVFDSDQISWLDKDKRLWAPSAIYHNGLYYLYFPIAGNGMVGVVTSKSPDGPWTDPLGKPMDMETMDPHVFIDDDGSAYMVAAMPHKLMKPLSNCDRIPYIVKMQDNLLGYQGEKHLLDSVEYRAYSEASWLHKHNDKYYYSYKGTSRGGLAYQGKIHYMMSDHPMGPYEYTGVIMDETTGHNRSNHNGIIEYKNNWYVMTHSRIVSNYRFRRNVIITPFDYNKDGTITKVDEPAYDMQKVLKARNKFGTKW